MTSGKYIAKFGVFMPFTKMDSIYNGSRGFLQQCEVDRLDASNFTEEKIKLFAQDASRKCRYAGCGEKFKGVFVRFVKHISKFCVFFLQNT